jgi:valyl-tRNA synthetase
VRNLRSQVNLPPGRKAKVLLRASGNAALSLEQERPQLARLAFAEPVQIDAAAAKPQQALTAIIGDEVEAYPPLAGVIDLEAEIARLEKELDQVVTELRQAQGKLQNPGFLQKAPPEVVAKEQSRREESLARQAKLEARLRDLR